MKKWTFKGLKRFNPDLDFDTFIKMTKKGITRTETPLIKKVKTNGGNA